MKGAAGPPDHPVEDADLLQFLYLLPVGVIDFDRSGNVQIINPAAVNILAPSIGVASMFNVLDEFGIVWPELRSLLDEGEGLGPVVVDHRLAGSGPAGKWCLSLGLVRVADGRFMITVADATAIAEAERALRESEQRFRSVFEQTIDGLFILDDHGVIVEVNQAGAEMHGYEISELIGRRVTELLAAHELPRFALSTVAETPDDVTRTRWQHRRKDGSGVAVELSARRRPEGGFLSVVRDITALVESEANVKAAIDSAEAQRGLLSELIDRSPVGIGLYDADFRCMQINEALAEINGVAVADTVGRRPEDYIPDLWPTLEPHFRRGLHTPTFGTELEGETPARPGEQRWWLVNFFPVTLGPGRPGVAVMVVEITARKRAEILLAQSENRFREMADASPLLVWEHDADGDQVWVNQTFYQFFGLTPGELSEGEGQELAHPEDSDAYTQDFMAAVAERREFHNSVRARRHDGQWRWLESWGKPRFDRDGVYLGHHGTSADVTDRVESHRQAAEAAAFTGRVLNGLFAFASVLDVDGTLLDANRAPLEAAGLQRSDVVGRRFWDCYWWSYSEQVAADLRRATARAAGGEIVRYDVLVRVLDGALLPIDFQVAPLYDDAGVVTHLVASGLDISDRTELEELTRQAQWRAETLESTATNLAAALTFNDVGAVLVGAANEFGTAVLDAVGPLGLTRVAAAGGNGDAVEEPPTIPLETPSPATAAVNEQATVIVNDRAELLDRYPEYAATVGGLRTASIAAIPCRTAGGEINAVLSVASSVAGWFAPDRVSLLEAFASQAGGALERATLYENAQLARRRADGLAQVLVALEQAATTTEQLNVLIGHLLDDLADYATIEAPDQDPPLLAIGHVDPDMVPVLRQLRTQHRIANDAVHSVAQAATGEGQLITEVTRPVWAQYTIASEAVTLLERLGPRSHMAVGIDLGGGARGAIMVGRTSPDAPLYTTDDLAYLQELAARTGVVLAAGRARRVQHEASFRLQRALLPDSLRWDPRVPIDARYQAAGDLLEVGGDWYDTFAWSNGHIGAIVGDVVGHSIDSAAGMGRLRAATAAIATNSAPDPAALLDALDDFARGPDGVPFATAACVVIDPETGTMTYSSAGHPPAIVVTPDNELHRLDKAQNLPLAVLGRTDRRSGTIDLEPGSVVVLYSDGLVERRNERLDHGITRLEQMVRNHADLSLDALADRLVTEYSAGASTTDDIVVLCLRYAPVVSEFHQTIPADSQQLATVRSELRSWLAEYDVDRASENDILLAVGEATANAIEHAYHGRDPATVDIDGTYHRHHLNFEIRDQGRWRRPGEHSAHRGRGTNIIKVLANRYDRRSDPAGTTVSITLPVQHRPEGSPS